MKLVAVPVLLACFIAPRIASADEPEDFVGQVIYTGMGSLVVASTIASVKLGIDDLSDAPPTRTRQAVELGVSSVGLAIGTSFLVLGEDQHDRVSRTFGLVMIAATLPTTIHGAWGMAAGADVDADDRRRAGMIELAFAVPLIGGEALAVSGFASDPVDHVRAAGVTTATALLVPSALMAAHGVYLLATTHELVVARHGPRMNVMPVLVGSGTLGIGAAGQF